MTLLPTGIVGAAILDVKLAGWGQFGFGGGPRELRVPFIIHTAVNLPPARATRFSGLVVQSISSAQAGGYALLGLDREPPPVYKENHDPRVLYAFKALHDIRT